MSSFLILFHDLSFCFRGFQTRRYHWLSGNCPEFRMMKAGLLNHSVLLVDSWIWFPALTYSTAFTLNDTFLFSSLLSSTITLIVSPMVRTSEGFSTLLWESWEM